MAGYVCSLLPVGLRSAGAAAAIALALAPVAVAAIDVIDIAVAGRIAVALLADSAIITPGLIGSIPIFIATGVLLIAVLVHCPSPHACSCELQGRRISSNAHARACTYG